MMAFLQELWRYQWGAPNDPVFRHEEAGWSYMKLWRGLRRSCLPLMLVSMLVSLSCCSLWMLAIFLEDTPPPPESLPLAALAGLFGLLMAAEVIRWIAGLLATALTATSISAEVEAETYGLLRLTPIPTSQIVLAKFGAAYRQLRLPMFAIAWARITALSGMVSIGLGLLAGTIYYSAQVIPPLSGPTPLPFPQIDILPLLASTTSYILAALGVLLALALWLIYIIVEPFLTMMLFASLGMLGSAWAKSRSGGLVMSFGIRAALGAAGYILGQILSLFFSLLSVPLAILPSSPLWYERLLLIDPGWLVFGGSLLMAIYLIGLIAGQYGLSALLLNMASRRAARLPYTT